MRGYLRRLWRFHLDPNRLTCEVVAFPQHRWVRVTKRRGKIVGIEMWREDTTEEFTYGYECWKKAGFYYD